MTVPLTLYRWGTRLISPVLPLYLSRRRRAGKETGRSVIERFGTVKTSRPHGPVIWVHAASLGESATLLPVVRRMLAAREDIHVVFTTQTTSAASVMADRLPPRALPAYAPLDVPGAVRSFLDHWRPTLFVVAESELWPNTLREISRRGMAALLLNARMNADSVARWKRFPKSFAKLIATFDYVHPADDATAVALQGARRLGPVGNLKAAVRTPEPDADRLAKLRTQIKKRVTGVFASIHPEEMDAVCALATPHAACAHILVPRYPDRDYGDVSNFIVLDRFGDTGLAYAVADWVVMGGSLAPGLRGHNPLEACHHGLPVASGPHVDSFAQVYSRYHAVMGEAELISRVGAWTADAGLRARDGATARAFARAEAAILDTIWADVRPFVMALAKDPG